MCCQNFKMNLLIGVICIAILLAIILPIVLTQINHK